MTTRLTKTQVADLEEAVGKPFVSNRWVQQRENVKTNNEEYNAETAAAKALLAKQDLFRSLAKKHFGYECERSNERASKCAATGEPVPENKGLLVKQNNAWAVYSRRGALKLILANAEIVEG